MVVSPARTLSSFHGDDVRVAEGMVVGLPTDHLYSMLEMEAHATECPAATGSMPSLRLADGQPVDAVAVCMTTRMRRQGRQRASMPCRPPRPPHPRRPRRRSRRGRRKDREGLKRSCRGRSACPARGKRHAERPQPLRRVRAGRAAAGGPGRPPARGSPPRGAVALDLAVAVVGARAGSACCRRARCGSCRRRGARWQADAEAQVPRSPAFSSRDSLSATLDASCRR